MITYVLQYIYAVFPDQALMDQVFFGTCIGYLLTRTCVLLYYVFLFHTFA